MTHEDNELPEAMRAAARDYHTPPDLPDSVREAMWSAIEAEAFPRRFSTPSNHRHREQGEHLHATRRLAPLAAVLVLGIAVGRFTAPRVASAPASVATAAPVTDSVAVPDAYHSTTSRYLGQTTALLISLPSDGRAMRGDDLYVSRAHDLLLTTRLLLDSPAAADPRFRALLDDLELVLAQVVRLQAERSGAELELIRQALEQRDVLSRLLTAAADISADD